MISWPLAQWLTHRDWPLNSLIKTDGNLRVAGYHTGSRLTRSLVILSVVLPRGNGDRLIPIQELLYPERGFKSHRATFFCESPTQIWKIQIQHFTTGWYLLRDLISRDRWWNSPFIWKQRSCYGTYRTSEEGRRRKWRNSNLKMFSYLSVNKKQFCLLFFHFLTPAMWAGRTNFRQICLCSAINKELNNLFPTSPTSGGRMAELAICVSHWEASSIWNVSRMKMRSLHRKIPLYVWTSVFLGCNRL